jgi:PepSY-associated transmembrane protein
MAGAGAQFKKGLIFVHRWMGVFFCLLFLSWFASGFVMMYWPYPQVSEADRLSRAPALDASRIHVSPQEAYARLEIDSPPMGAQLATFDGRPAYRFRTGLGDVAIVYADDGQMQEDFPPALTLRIASTWTRQARSDAKEEDTTEADQWTVSEEFADLRPLRKYSWPDGQQVYVSTVTGDVVQYTTRGSRLAAYFGAIPHWLYLTPLRKRGQQWSRLVIWSSGLGTLAAILGITVGLWMYSPWRTYRYAGEPASFPYHGQKRWHAILGLFFGLFACTWAFSGMLSMDPFPKLQEGASEGPDARLASALRQTPPLEVFSAKAPQAVVAEAKSVFGSPMKALELTSCAGEPAYLAVLETNDTRVIPVLGRPATEFDRDRIIAALERAARPLALTQVRLVTEYESYYLDRDNQLPLPVIFVELNDQARSSYYIDPRTARIVQSYNSNSRWNRWVYHGFHSLNLPWLYKHRPAWDIAVILLLLGGASLSVTALILAWNVLWRKLAPWASPSEMADAGKGITGQVK